MSKYIDAEKFRADIERRRKNWLAASRLVKKGKDTAMYAAGKSSAYTEFLSFLDTLEEPVSEDLEKEIDAYYKEWDGNCRYAQTARHFAEWGAEHLKK